MAKVKDKINELKDKGLETIQEISNKEKRMFLFLPSFFDNVWLGGYTLDEMMMLTNLVAVFTDAFTVAMHQEYTLCCGAGNLNGNAIEIILSIQGVHKVMLGTEFTTSFCKAGVLPLGYPWVPEGKYFKV